MVADSMAIKTKKQWKARITKACKDAGTYQPYFVPIIDTLATILETRDRAQYTFEQAGSRATIVHTNKAGAANIQKSPQLTAIMDLNTQALSYWRDLGLTPAGLRKINAEAIEERKAAGPMELLIDALNG